MTRPRFSIGQSADPDDAFMAWGLATGVVTLPNAELDVVFGDIQTLNEWALEGRLDLTALSAGAYPHVADNYRLLRTGASFGAQYGPLVVGREPVGGAGLSVTGKEAVKEPELAATGEEAVKEPGPAAIAGLRVAVPGLLTTAYLLLRTYAGDSFEPVPMRFDLIIDAVVDGSVDAGLIIHEGQLTYREQGLHALFEPARAWHEELGLPVPLGVVGVRRALGDNAQMLAEAFAHSIEAARQHPEEALAFAASHGRGLDEETLKTFVDQYVDEITMDMGAEGVEALRRLYERAATAGLIEGVPPLDLL